MYEFHTVQSNRNYSEKPQDSNNKNIRINGFVTVSPQVFIIENRVKATGPSVSCYMPFCRGLAWAGTGWTATEFSACLQQGLLLRGTSRAPRGFGMLSRMLKLKLQGPKSTGHYILYIISSTVLTVTLSVKTSCSTEFQVSPGGYKTSHTEMGTLTNTQCYHQGFPKRI